MNETDLTLVDYFAVIGLDKNSGLRPDPSLEFLAELSGNSGANERLPPLERSYEAKVLSHFPEKRRGLIFPHEIASLCMPKGLKFYTETKVPMDPQFHSFVIIREDGTRMNGCALTLYEEVKDESIRQAMYDLQMDHVKEIAASESQNRVPYDSRTRQQPGTISFGNHTMPRHISARRNRQKRISYYDSTSKPIFVSKCIALLTRIPMVFTSEKILRSLADMIKSNHHALPVPLESFIYWVLHEVPLPVPGTTLQLNYSGIDLIVIRPPSNDLPFFDYPLQHVFNYISVEKFLKLFTCFLLEHQILLCSKHMDRLMLVSESLSNLVFPFRWQLTYVPILPYNQLKFIEAPVPYLMGLCYDDYIPDQIYQSNICILDIDNKKLDFPEDVPPFPKYRQLGDEISKILEQVRKSPSAQREIQGIDPPKVVMRKKNPGSSRRSDLLNLKRLSRSFENPESILSSEDNYKKQLEKESEILNDSENSKNDETYSKGRDKDEGYGTTSQSPISEETQNYFQGLRLNQAVRDLMLNHFACLFYSYDSFLIGEGSASRDSVVNFDKASFLSDQPDSFLPFLAAFLETQMFASFIDSKILSQFHSSYDENITVFDQKILQVREKLSALKVQTPTIEKPADILLSEDSREVFCPLPISSIQMDYEVRQPRILPGTSIRNYGGFFPEMDPRIFETNLGLNSTHSPWKQQKQRQRTNSLLEESALTPKNTPKKKPNEEGKSREHWKFVEQLLKETKTKTKRMLVLKMGKEAVHLGHNDIGITGVEENTLVATFCDLLERVWAHGLKKKQGKSALWTHVLSHQQRERDPSVSRNVEHSSNLTPDFAPHWSNESASSVPSSSNSSVVGAPAGYNSKMSILSSPMRSRPRTSDDHQKKRSLSRPRSPIERDKQLKPLPTHIAYDLKSVMEMNEIKTDIGCARAFVRLALERKLLHKHLKTIFSNEHLLQKLYRRYAFLRSEDEREQFLYHILSLNAVDFSCFTNTFIATKMQYEVLLVAGLDRFASASVWIMITGSLGNTSIINLPPNSLQFTFDHKNLGVLSTLRIGHNLNQKNINPSKWFLDHILIRNNITGQTFRFGCGRWFGKGVDDGALERLLVAEVLPRETPEDEGPSASSGSMFSGLISRPESPSSVFSTSSARLNQNFYSTQSLARKKRSPSVTRNAQISDNGNSAIIEIEHRLGASVNSLMKFFLNDQNFSGGGASLTPLLCGENGLVSVLEQVFSHGRKRDFINLFHKLYPWDYIEQVFVWFSSFIVHPEWNRIGKERQSLIVFSSQLVKIIKNNPVVGKEGKFHVFILLTIRDHILASLLPLMVRTPITAEIYSTEAFIRKESRVSYLSKLLASLNEFNFILEKSLTHGIDI